MKKFKNKYRIQSARAIFWDYRSDGSYFITICVNNRTEWFGDVINGEMKHTKMGEIALQYISEIPLRFPYASVDSYVVMPNHIHLIISLRNNRSNTIEVNGYVEKMPLGRSPNNNHERVVDFTSKTKGPIGNEYKLNGPDGQVSDRPTPTHGRELVPNSKNPMLNDHLAKVIRWYKGRVKYESRAICPKFQWQTRYYDVIIRNNLAYQRIKNYIINNPINWEKDRFFHR